MWRVLCASVRGSRHERADEVSQDRCAFRRFPYRTPDGRTSEGCALACCDGAGSTVLGGVGAEIATDEFLSLAEAYGREHADVPDRPLVLAWLERLRQRIAERAAEHEVPMREFATTFLGALLTERGVLAIQIGDGAIVIGHRGRYVPIFWPDGGEFAGSTWFLTDARFEEHTRIAHSIAPVTELALFTDGLERLALQFDSETAHEPFFRPLFGELAKTEDAEALRAPLERMLTGEAVRARTDDDVSLLVVMRGGAPTPAAGPEQG